MSSAAMSINVGSNTNTSTSAQQPSSGVAQSHEGVHQAVITKSGKKYRVLTPAAKASSFYLWISVLAPYMALISMVLCGLLYANNGLKIGFVITMFLVFRVFGWLCDIMELGNVGLKFETWMVTGFLFPPAYFLIRARKTNHKYLMTVLNAIPWFFISLFAILFITSFVQLAVVEPFLASLGYVSTVSVQPATQQTINQTYGLLQAMNNAALQLTGALSGMMGM